MAIPVRISTIAIPACLLPAAAASAQFTINWYTVDGGGGTSTGGGFTLHGTAGQHDAGAMTGVGGLQLLGGYWGAAATVACYANCDNSTQPPVLNVQDFSCFLTRYAANDPYANCDNSTQPPILNVQDFSCFLTKYAAGCP